MVALVQLVAQEPDNLGYITYVFKCLEDDVAAESRYIMCVRYPNWDHRKLQLKEVGYLTFNEVKAGVDKWFDGNSMVPYNYNGVQFMKFVSKPETADHQYIMLITLNLEYMKETIKL